MKIKNIFFPFVILLFGFVAFAQDIPQSPNGGAPEELEKKAVEYLRETASEINTLRTNENRISFSSELANLMWFHDEKEARKMFSAVADNFVQLLVEYNGRLEALGGMRDESDLYGGFRMSRDQRRDAVKRLYKARDVRGNVALAIAEHDAQLAYDFVIRTTTVITDRALAENFNEQNKVLEKQILERMAVTNVESSLAFARRSLKRGINSELVELAAKIYKKDPEGAIEFGKDLVEKVRSEAKPEDESFAIIRSILETGGAIIENAESGQKPLFDKRTLEGLADLLAKNILSAEEVNIYMVDEYVSEIEKYSPYQARRVKEKFADKDGDSKLAIARSLGFPTKESDPDDQIGAPVPSPQEAAEQARDEERKALMAELQEFGNNGLSSEQKAKFVDKARRIISDMDDPMMKILALSTLATQVKILGDAEFASEIMSEANALVKPNPRNFLDYALIWTLVSGYAQVSPQQAFPPLEDAIYRLNDTIGAVVKVAEFMDVQEDIVIDGEVQVGAFGGSMTRSLVGMTGISGNVLKSLAQEDFERTKALADKFERPEIRILARFLVLRSMLETNETKGIGLVK